MATVKSGNSSGEPLPNEPANEAATSHPLPAPVASPANLLRAKLGDSETFSSRAEIFYRAACDIALAEAREAAQSEEEVSLIFPSAFAQVMVEHPVAKLAEVFARAEDPDLLMIRLISDCAVERYLRSKRTKKTSKNKRPT